MDGEDRSVDPELDPLFSYPQIPSVFPPPTSHEAAADVSVGRGSSSAPRVGLARPPPAAPPVASVQGGTGGGRLGPAAGRSGQAAPQAWSTNAPWHGDQMDWNDAHLQLACELMAKQVSRGNRPNTHLNSVGYTEVSARFLQMTGISLSKTQIKNKWDKLKADWTIWLKLKRRQTGTGWNNATQTIDMKAEWWKKAKNDIPGCGKFRKKLIQNEDLLRKMFKNITNEEADHWNPFNNSEYVDGENNVHGDPFDANKEGGEEVQEVTPSAVPNKKPRVAVVDRKKAKSSIALLMVEAISKISGCSSSFTAKKQEGITITEIMEHVKYCGAAYGSDEHDIATQLFVKKEHREMSMTLPTREIRLNWLRKRHNDKYEKTLYTPGECHSQLRMSTQMFYDLHDLLVGRKAQNQFKHSGETIHRKFDEILNAFMDMSRDFIRPKDPNF
ncbi:L10-interacting MYB domain-containing protein-like [Miscanthus floridulus]|uniref:L10-interacting MYB domain-containing protein-like n=1 Tax=Miscanthus floridulus TaxID=154761 RepID=UPI00345A147B